MLELGGSIAGPYAGMLLCAAGAEVIRVETPEDCAQPAGADGGIRRYVRAMREWLHHGKRSMAFRSAEAARPHVDALVASADVIVDELAPSLRGALGRIPPFAPPRPWVMLTPFGAEAWSRQASDTTLAAVTGAMWAIGEPGREPLAPPHAQVAVHAGTVAAMLAAAAIGAEGPPHLIDIALADVTAAYASMNALIFDWRREGHRAAMSGGIYPYTLLPCKDGYVCLAARTNAEWRGVIEVLGTPDWAARPEFADARDIAINHADEADLALMTTLAGFTKEQILKRATEVGASVVPVRTIEEVASDADLRRTGTVVDIEIDGERVAVPTMAWLGGGAGRTAPAIGAHNEEIAAELRALGRPVDARDLWRPA